MTALCKEYYNIPDKFTNWNREVPIEEASAFVPIWDVQRKYYALLSGEISVCRDPNGTDNYCCKCGSFDYILKWHGPGDWRKS